jgi:predicted helicase
MAVEGLDIPILDTVLFATPKSNKACIQQAIGRILRSVNGKKTPPFIVDIYDPYSLFINMYQKRKRIYQSSGYKQNQLN